MAKQISQMGTGSVQEIGETMNDRLYGCNVPFRKRLNAADEP